MWLRYLLVLLLLTACTRAPPIAPAAPVAPPAALAPPSVPPEDPAPAVAAPPPALTAADLYEKYAGRVAYVKVECVYDYTYPSYFVRSKVDKTWGLFIDLAMRKNTTLITDQTPGGPARLDTWGKEGRVNSTKQYGTAFVVGNQVYTNSHVIACPNDNRKIVDYFDLNDLSGENVTAIGEHIYNDQADFEELSVSEDVIFSTVNRTVAEHFRSKGRFTLNERRITLYLQDTNFQAPVTASVLRNGTEFPGKDYAILTTKAPLQSLPKGPHDPAIGDRIYVLGFPGLNRFEYPEEHNGSQTNPPTITSGTVSSKIQSDESVTYYVMDATTTFGSSGSPIINQDGDVIGIMTAGDYFSDFGAFLPINDIPN
jgi:S1-C subfamily serine protease